MEQCYTDDEREYAAFPEVSDLEHSRQYKPVRFESYGDFEKYRRKAPELSDLREESEFDEPSSTVSHQTNATYTLREIATPLQRWKCSVKQEKPGNFHRKNSVAAQLLEHRYFQPWEWKPTGDPETYERRRYKREREYDDNGSSSIVISIMIILIIIGVVVAVANKDALQRSFATYTDLKAFKVKVEDNVKNMIDTDFKPFSWQNEGDENEKNYGIGGEQNPSVMKHIRHFEELLKRKPNKFFPAAKSPMVAFKDEEDE